MALALAGLGALAACAEDPTATPTPTSPPAAPDATPTPSPTPTPTPSPTPTPGPKYGGTLSYWIRSDPPGWDPWGRTRFWDPTRKIAELVFNPLYSPTAHTGDSCKITLDGEIARSWSFVEPTVLEFKLREGVMWHDKPPLDGRELTADDVAYTLNERYAQGLAGGSYVNQVFFDRAEATDRYTVRVHLHKPFDFIKGFPSGNRQGWIVAPEASAEDALEDPSQSWVGTGPYMFVEHETGTKVRFERNPNYFKDGLPYADAVEAHIIPDGATRLAALRGGQINVFPAASPRVLEEVGRVNPDYFMKSCPSLFHLEIRMRLDKEPWNDVNVRRALSMSIDREAVVATALRGDGAPVLEAWPLDAEALTIDGYPEDVQPYLQYNPEMAKQLLADAGYPDGFKTSVAWTATYGSPWQEVAETMLTMMRAVGIEAEFNMMEYGPFLGAGSAQSWDDLYFGWTNSFDLDDLSATYFWSEQMPANTLSLNPDATLDGIVERLWGSTGEAREAVAEELQVYVAENAYRITSPVWGNGIVARPEVKNVGWRGTNKMYHRVFENAWLDE